MKFYNRELELELSKQLVLRWTICNHFFLKSLGLASLSENFLPENGLSDLKDLAPGLSERPPRPSSREKRSRDLKGLSPGSPERTSRRPSPRGAERSRDLKGVSDLNGLSGLEDDLRGLNGLSDLKGLSRLRSSSLLLGRYSSRDFSSPVSLARWDRR